MSSSKMISNTIERRSAIAPVMLLGSIVMPILAVGTTNSMPYNTDCMKNPYANGCRGISAKRSPALLWSSQAGSGNDVDGKAATRTNIYDLIGSRQANQFRANQLSVITDLLFDATHRLANLAEWNSGVQSALARQNQEMPSNFLLSQLATNKRVIVNKVEGQREEAAAAR